VQVVLIEPDLVDADALGQLDLVELAPEQLLMRRILARRRGRPDGEPHASPPRLPAAACRGLGAMLLASGHAVNPRRALPPHRAAERPGLTALCGGLRQALKASAIFHRPKPQNPLKPGDRAALVALAEIVEAGHFDDVGDVNQAADHSERKPARDGEGDPILQAAPWSHGAATTDRGE